jgi:hypothetical protein
MSRRGVRGAVANGRPAMIIIAPLVAVLATFPLAGVCALCFRFPVPFAGYVSGPDGVMSALFGVLFYGVVTPLLLVLAFAGFVTGAVAEYWWRHDRRKAVGGAVAFSVLESAMAVGALSVLDKIIGPW